ncbi:purine-cytosine permease family protein [Pseudomonas vancouverensis]|uniref:Cytosine permease n=1 Tax=Pseudomonas vancouverensis TaxID=95300 RepID=A0A1H2NPS8_PSEVA|nr:cytosine permease [Pseudomonas vancouverensis]KAB0495372.1 cytosine permease [Pseudomonas vancouverensis]TDB62445.1 cytosine permease [Pseudomonas vancouverensis]SDV07075.1 nucleobase:cation symporter-1, NCS1 family [Pseudomonas vancouverensis]
MGTSPNTSRNGPLIERRSIDFIPDNERHGSLWSQFTLWVSANLTVTCAVTGALTVVLGGDVFWSLVGLFIGQLIGGMVMALHGAQGPRTGLPQMITSRVQFGVYGAIIPLVLVCIMYVGFLTSSTVLTGQAVGQLLDVSTTSAILILGVLVALLALFGYRTIHALGRVYSVVGGLTFLYLFVSLLSGHEVSALLGNRHFTWPTFLFALSLSASWQISYGPYVADYSRYLPRSTSPTLTFVMVGAGSVLGSQLAMTFGVFAAAIAGDRFAGHEVTFMVGLGSVGLVATVLYLAITLGKLMSSALSIYGSVMSVATISTALTGKSAIGNGMRFVLIMSVVTLYTSLALVADHGFLKTFGHFILFLLAFFTPWSAINLVDYYCVEKDNIDVQALNDVNGRYGKWNIPGISTYILGVLIQIPFMSSEFYTGPLFDFFGGIDVSWIVGLLIPGALYYFCSRYRLPHQTQQAVQSNRV